MSLNVDAIRDFGTILCSIPFDTLSIQDFYCSIWSFYIGLMECYVKFYGKNNPYVVNIDHAFENFLQKCDYVEPLPEGIVQFTGMMVLIICDMYQVDLNAIMCSVQEMRGEPDPVEVVKLPVDKLEPMLNNEEVKELAHEIVEKKQAKEVVSEQSQSESKINWILVKVRTRDITDKTISKDLRLALIDGLKQDECEHWVEKIRSASKKKGKGCA